MSIPFAPMLMRVAKQIQASSGSGDHGAETFVLANERCEHLYARGVQRIIRLQRRQRKILRPQGADEVRTYAIFFGKTSKHGLANIGKVSLVERDARGTLLGHCVLAHRAVCLKAWR